MASWKLAFIFVEYIQVDDQHCTYKLYYDFTYVEAKLACSENDYCVGIVKDMGCMYDPNMLSFNLCLSRENGASSRVDCLYMKELSGKYVVYK